MKEFASAEWDRARRSLESALALVETDPDSAVSRAYYAAFHALTALFGLRGQMFSKHSSLRVALHRDLVQTGILEKETGKDYDFLLELREVGDYGGIAHVLADSARQAVEKAESLIAAVVAACPELAGGDSED